MDCQDILPGNVISIRLEEKEAKEAMEEKEDIRAQEKGKVKEEERVIRDLAGIVVRKFTSQQKTGMQIEWKEARSRWKEKERRIVHRSKLEGFGMWGVWSVKTCHKGPLDVMRRRRTMLFSFEENGSSYLSRRRIGWSM